MRSETGQWMRRSRSPGRKARMSASSVPPPGRVDRCWPTRPDGVRQAGPRGEVTGPGHRRHDLAALVRVDPHEAAEVPERGHLGGPEAAHAPPARLDPDGERNPGAPRRRARPVAPLLGGHVVRRRGDVAVGRGGARPTVTREVADDVPQPVDRLDVEAPGEGLALADDERVDAARDPRCTPGGRHERPDDRGEQRDADDGDVAATEPGPEGQQGEPERRGPAEGAGGAPAPAHAERTATRGVGTVRRTSATTVRGVTSPIHSSGRTTTRCSRTEGATALTSSGVT